MVSGIRRRYTVAARIPPAANIVTNSLIEPGSGTLVTEKVPAAVEGGWFEMYEDDNPCNPVTPIRPKVKVSGTNGTDAAAHALGVDVRKLKTEAGLDSP